MLKGCVLVDVVEFAPLVVVVVDFGVVECDVEGGGSNVVVVVVVVDDEYIVDRICFVNPTDRSFGIETKAPFGT